MSKGDIYTQQADDRPLHIFEVPDALKKYGISKIGLVELSADEEIMAAKRSQNNLIRSASEQAKMSLRMVNDKAVSVAGAGDDSADAVFNKLHPKVRQLVMVAYASLHVIDEGEATSFLATHQTRVG